ncbi:hypothetical protein A2841_02155 [Candidatus Kaiserbacteria bacterium RIFCSPHIGHO2_01_FULL_48_10]|uniref:Uncharacterized protein n=1 Tax=Candidatus Kaiserbacteria bacterium RIFCSPHIGHO2_01_FULL_48_10 TaxID=1798476 RepID=A0A1F6C142_9BACT|nr:MAG: hypothetical protein A2841_02155 [Candidatus Kaiserbacteria bacterium RIFCSPHIGHO2_01_FULL_48_10]HLC99729.1 hypothetical protein [Patescibacteria group bacterium]
MENNVFVQSLRYIFRDVLGDFLLYPIWWYTKGFLLTLQRFGERVGTRSRALALGIQVANLFRPMYADYSIQGRIISFVARILILIFRLLEMAFFIAGYLIMLLLWIFLPVIVIASLLHQWFLIDLRVIPFLK